MRLSLTQEVTELLEDVEAGRPSLLQEEGGAPGSLGQRAEARPQVSRRLLGLLRLLGPSSGDGEDREDCVENWAAMIRNITTVHHSPSDLENMVVTVMMSDTSC